VTPEPETDLAERFIATWETPIIPSPTPIEAKAIVTASPTDATTRRFAESAGQPAISDGGRSDCA
jgi:hypothetical protein